jgi:hypothetical protein
VTPFAKIFVEVELVMVALVVVRSRTLRTFAQRVARTFRLVIDEVEIVVVPRVVVAADKFPATVFVKVAFVAVNSEIVVVAKLDVPVFDKVPVVVEYVSVFAEIKFPAPSVSCTVKAEPVAVLAPTAVQLLTPVPLAMYRRPEDVSMAREPVALEAIPTGVPEAIKKLAVEPPCDSANTEVVVEVVATVRTEFATWLVPIPTFVVEVAINNL